MNKPRFSPLIEGLSAPPVPAVQAWGHAYDGGEGPLIDLSQAVPGYPPHPDLLAWLSEAAGSTAYAGYGAIEGERELREAYGAHVSGLSGADIAAEEVHITSGCNQAFVTAAMAVAAPGEAVLLTNPCYFNHETTLSMLGIGVRYLDCRAENGFLPDPADLPAALAKGVRALALVSPNNPTGAVYPTDLLEEIFAVCRARGVWLILDETYRDFLSQGSGRPHGLFAKTGWQDGLISLYSFSKSFCIPGHRLGAVTAGREVIAQIAKIMDNLQICAPRAAQAAVARGLPALVGWREENRLEIGRRAEAMKAAIAAAPGWKLDAIGAYFGFVRHPYAGISSLEIGQILAKNGGILTIPGQFFGRDLERHLRVAFANADSDGIADFGRRLARFSV